MSKDSFGDNDFLNPEIEKKYSDHEKNHSQEQMSIQPIEPKLTWSERRAQKKASREQQRMAEELQRELEKAKKEEQRKIEEQEKIRQQAILEEEKRIEALEKQQAKELRKLEKRERPVPVYKWFFFLILMAIPLVNVFFIFYWGFFSERVNKNIRTLIIGALFFALILVALSVFTYFNTDQLDPRVLQIFSNFFDELCHLFSIMAEQLRQSLQF